MTIQAKISKRGRPGVLIGFLGRFQPDGFVLALIGTVTMASLLPCQGTGAVIFHAGGSFAIASLFFLQGARLSRAAVAAGAKHWRLHFVIASTNVCALSIAGVGPAFAGSARTAAVTLVR